MGMSLIPALVFLSVLMACFGFRYMQGVRGDKTRALLGLQGEERVFESVEKESLMGRILKRFSDEGITIPFYQFMGMFALVSGGLFVVGFYFTRNLWQSFLFVLAGYGVFGYVLRRRRNKRLERFELQLEGVINYISAGLRAGSSLAQTISDASYELDEPAAREFRQMRYLISTGVPAAEVLAEAARRIGSSDLQMVATATLVHARAGGNLPEILDHAAETIRERRALKASLRAITAEGKWSGYIIGAMPVALTLIFSVINPGYFKPMIASLGGRVLLMGSFLMIILGWLMIRNSTQRLDF